MKQKKIFICLTIALLFAACEKESPNDLLSEAKTLIPEQKYSEALEKLRLLLDKYPNAAEAAESRYMIGDTHIATNKNFEAALEEYAKVVEDYPDSRFAINAQFMIGYVFANFMRDYESARVEYERFLELFESEADSGIVQSVKFELKNLGKDLNEIPQLKHISS